MFLKPDNRAKHAQKAKRDMVANNGNGTDELSHELKNSLRLRSLTH